MIRRTFLALPAAIAASTAPNRLRYSICSGAFAGQSLAEMCQSAKRCGYTGLELEPGNISDDPASLSKSDREMLRKMIAESGVGFVGLHGFLRVPKGMHLTGPDAEIRSKTWNYFDRLIDLAADLGPHSTMVLGQARQREAIDAVTRNEAISRITEGLAKLARHAERRDVTILLEPLAPHLCNVINTLSEAVAIIERIASPAIQSIFDSHNTAGEAESPDQLLKLHHRHIRHVHLNEMDGRYPGSGQFPFNKVLGTLRDLKYKGWVSVELFDFKPDGETVARRSIEYLRSVEGNR